MKGNLRSGGPTADQQSSLLSCNNVEKESDVPSKIFIFALKLPFKFHYNIQYVFVPSFYPCQFFLRHHFEKSHLVESVYNRNIRRC